MLERLLPDENLDTHSFPAEMQVVLRIPFPTIMRTYMGTGKIMSFIFEELAHRLQKECKARL